MITILIAAHRSQESHILLSAFKQKGLLCRILPPDGSTYLKIQTSKPNVVLVDLPKDDIDQIKFVEKISNNKLLSSLPIIGYGNPVDRAMLNRYLQAGIRSFIARPLKFGTILDILARALTEQSDLLDSKEQKNKAAYFDTLLSSKIVASEKLKVMSEQVDRAKAFPFTITKIISLTEKNNTSIKGLAKAIESDPTMTANTLKISNSVFFRSRFRVDGKIKTIPDAIVRIGFAQTKKIAASLIVADLINKEESSFGFQREEFWFHSIATAIIAEHLAKRCNLKEPSLAYLAGLLHEYGVVVYDDYLREIFILMLEHTFNERCSFDATGMELIGLTQNEFTHYLFEEWSLPTELCTSIRYHKKFIDIPDTGLDNETQKLCHIVGLSSLIAKCINIGRSCDEYIHTVPNALMKKLVLPHGLDMDFFVPIYQEVALYSEFFDMGDRPIPARCFIAGPEKEPFTLTILNDDTTILEPHLLYLQSIGFALVHFEDLDHFNELSSSQKIDLCIVNTSEKVTYEEYAPYLDTMHSFSVPKLVFTDTGTGIVEDTYTRALPKTLDLHLVLRAVEDLLKNHKHEYLSIAHDT
ncbi:MAG: HDOD domain-containing protein [Fibrobacterales bacterium]